MAVDAMMREIMNIGWTSSQVIRHLSQSGNITLEERKELLVRRQGHFEGVGVVGEGIGETSSRVSRFTNINTVKTNLSTCPTLVENFSNQAICIISYMHKKCEFTWTPSIFCSYLFTPI